MRPCVIDYSGSYRFSVPPDVIWSAIERTDRFEGWWSWLGAFHLEGSGLERGAVLVGMVSPPLPYRMRVEVVLEDCVIPSSIEAVVHGDLEGTARLGLAAVNGGTVATATWNIEMMQRPMRAAAQVAYPLLRWGHDRVVDATVSAFRRQIEPPRSA